jgi:hypothetical protein
MALTKERKMILVVLGLAVGAFLVDRLVLDSGFSEPAQAQASEAVAISQAPILAGRTPAAEPVAPQADPAVAAQVALADRLAQLQDSKGFTLTKINDAFARPGGLAPPADLPNDRPEPSAAASAAETFQKTHRLMAVVASERGHMAIINGRTVRVGQSLDGFELLSVEQRSVLLGKDSVRVQLKLDPPGQPRPMSE